MGPSRGCSALLQAHSRSTPVKQGGLLSLVALRPIAAFSWRAGFLFRKPGSKLGLDEVSEHFRSEKHLAFQPLPCVLLMRPPGRP